MRATTLRSHDNHDMDRLIAVNKSLEFCTCQQIITMKPHHRFPAELARFPRWLLGKFVLPDVIAISAFVQPGCEWFAVGIVRVRLTVVINIAGVEPQYEPISRRLVSDC